MAALWEEVDQECQAGRQERPGTLAGGQLLPTETRVQTSPSGGSRGCGSGGHSSNAHLAGVILLGSLGWIMVTKHQSYMKIKVLSIKELPGQMQQPRDLEASLQDGRVGTLPA